MVNAQRTFKQSMPTQIREARYEDAEIISQLIGVLGYELKPMDVVERLLSYRGGCSRVFVASNDVGLVGFLSFYSISMFHEASRLGRITAMAIDQLHHRQGVGSLSVAAAERFAISVGCSRIEVTSGDRREKDAHVFYQAQGYHSDCRRFLKRLCTAGQDDEGSPSTATNTLL